MDAERALYAFGLTALAGLCTGIGGAVAFFTRRTDARLLSGALGFSAGVMIFISLTELLVESSRSLEASLGPSAGGWAVLGGFFGGILLTALIDRAVPEVENPHEARRIESADPSGHAPTRLLRMGLLTAGALTLHNFPEGLAVFVSALQDPAVGLSIAAAVAIHNIPEGASISVPIYYATGSRKKAFLYSTLTGLAEPLGALVGWFFLSRFLGGPLSGLTLAVTAGIMVFISFDELLPGAHEYGEHHVAVYGLMSGMAVMAVLLRLFA